jgi:hypothetical protein
MAKLARTEANGTNTQHSTGSKSEESKTPCPVNSLRHDPCSSRPPQARRNAPRSEDGSALLAQSIRYLRGFPKALARLTKLQNQRKQSGIGFVSQKAAAAPVWADVPRGKNQGGRSVLGSSRRRRCRLRRADVPPEESRSQEGIGFVSQRALPAPEGRKSRRKNQAVRRELASSRRRRCRLRRGRRLAGRVRQSGGNWVRLAETAAGSRRADAQPHWVRLADAADGSRGAEVPPEDQAVRSELGSSRRGSAGSGRADVPPEESRDPEGIGFFSQRPAAGPSLIGFVSQHPTTLPGTPHKRKFVANDQTNKSPYYARRSR